MNRSHLAALSAAAAALVASPAMAAPVITQTNAAAALAAAITGGNVTVLSASLQGAAAQSGTFTNGSSSVGFASGVVLSTGNVLSIPGPNANTSPETFGSSSGTAQSQISTNTVSAGYAPLGASTFDASVLTISFQFGDGSVGGDLFVNYVFASEEYINYVGSQFNDIFAFYLNNVNIALLPSTTTPVAINNVNPTTNSGSYINNVINTNGYSVAGRDFQFDGLTRVLTASAFGLGAGTHTMAFAIADVSDRFLDSAVFLQAGSFSTDQVPVDVPEPGSIALVGAALLGLAASRRIAAKRGK